MFYIKSKNRKFLIALTIAVLLIPFCYSYAYSGDLSDARSLGMGGAFTAVARNYRSLSYNPANLGLRDNYGSSLEMFSIGVDINNNSFSYGDYNKYSGAYLTDEDKKDIIDNIPSEGLSVDLSLEARAISFSVNSFAFSTGAEGISDFTLPKDPLELILYGNAIMPNLDLSTTKGEAYGVGDIAFGYGYPVIEWEDGEFSVGGTLHYLKGFLYEKIVQADGYAETGDTAITAAGNMIVKSAMGGSGYSFDLGVATRFKTDYVFSFSITNLYNKINWKDKTELTYFDFELNPLNANSIDNDSIATSSDTTITTEAFGSKRPAYIKMGLSSSYKNILWDLDYQQGFSNTPITSTTPQLSTGIEYRGINWLPLRSGISLGGPRGSYYAVGFGLDLGPYNFDLAIANKNSVLPSGSKGICFAISSYFEF